MKKPIIVLLLLAAISFAFVAFSTNTKIVSAAIDSSLLENEQIVKAIISELKLPKGAVLTEQNLKDVRSLRLDGKHITTLSGIEKLPNLESLSVEYTSVQDLSPLEGLMGIKVLHIKNSEVKDIAPLSKLSKLQWLNLTGNEIGDISPLSQLTDLRSVTVDNNRITDFGPLLHSPKLYIVSLKMNPVADISFLQKIPILQAIYMNGIQAANYDIMKEIKLLHYVMISPEQYEAELELWQELSTNNVDVTVIHSSNIVLEIDQKWIPAEVSWGPFIQNGVVMVPIRILSENLESVLEWNERSQAISITKGSRVIRLFMNQTQAWMDGSLLEMESAPIIVDNVAFVPVRFIAEAFHYDVAWNDVKKTVSLTTR
ncbi:hypothetical protein FE784_24690 [Paenibacillus hemerocallicola]|uniref:Copper amine oxidase-like N-terminal domain-containing protein n=1 Tax=Paenibacillus hemerocallicola TaxID=1172614 RepID=A0A5C4T4L6_9BACL|nr:leucine-rich repeat domain-containing protein [Paenibacillus hemerocallicola]TNJ63650.1 hypothetical protein FE784_24690 [Paenibacillus hemerocallicola]